MIPPLGGVGARGAGLTVVTAVPGVSPSLDTNPRPDAVFMAYVDTPHDRPMFRYRVGWNLDASGSPASVSDVKMVPGVGWDDSWSDVAAADLNGDQKFELIFMAYGPQGFRYKIAPAPAP